MNKWLTLFLTVFFHVAIVPAALLYGLYLMDFMTPGLTWDRWWGALVVYFIFRAAAAPVRIIEE